MSSDKLEFRTDVKVEKKYYIVKKEICGMPIGSIMICDNTQTINNMLPSAYTDVFVEIPKPLHLPELKEEEGLIIK